MTLLEKDVAAVEFDNIPDDLKRIDAWVLWKAEWNDGTQKYDKVPYQINGYSRASSINPDTWCSFEDVKKAYEDGVGHGVMIALDNSHSIYGLDIDDSTKYIYQETYCEYSPSGDGIHAYFSADKPKEHSNKKVIDNVEFELYSHSRFMTVTGHQCSDADSVLHDNNIIDGLISKLFTPKPTINHEFKQHSPKLSDDEVITLCREARSANKFSLLFDEGDTSNYGDDNSRADQALANIIAFYTQDPAQIERIMRMSALNRDKWDRKENYRYLERTIHEAIRSCDSYYKSSPDMGFKINLDGDKPATMEELKKALRQRHQQELEKAKMLHELKGKKGEPPKKLPAHLCSLILPEYVTFAMLDEDENARLNIYLPEEGIYTQKRNILYMIIGWLEPLMNENNSTEVAFYLTRSIEHTTPLTESRYLIPVNNGVFNLETKTLEPFSPNYVFTSKIDTDYKENPENPLIDGWDVDQFIRSIACDDTGIIKLLWQVISDSLNGNYSRQKAIFLLGEGANGKGTFEELIINLVGLNNVAPLTVKDFDPERQFRISELEGSTVVIGDDNPERLYMDDISNFKKAITGDVLYVERKWKQPYPIFFKGAVIQSTNDMPKFKASNEGVYRRIVIVPFNANFSGEFENSKIKEEYIKDKRVLEYVLHKAINMDFERFDIPHASQKELDIFKGDNDPLYNFVKYEFLPHLENIEDFHFSNRQMRQDGMPSYESISITLDDVEYIPKQFIYGWYKHYCEENGYMPLAQSIFFKQMSRFVSDKYETDKKYKFDTDDIIRMIHLLEPLGIYNPSGVPEVDVRTRSYKRKEYLNI